MPGTLTGAARRPCEVVVLQLLGQQRQQGLGQVEEAGRAYCAAVREEVSAGLIVARYVICP
jgi:hypothetical protein